MRSMPITTDPRGRLSHMPAMPLPWEIIEGHEAQAEKNHGQTLEQLRARGGLSAAEDAFAVPAEYLVPKSTTFGRSTDTQLSAGFAPRISNLPEPALDLLEASARYRDSTVTRDRSLSGRGGEGNTERGSALGLASTAGTLHGKGSS